MKKILLSFALALSLFFMLGELNIFAAAVDIPGSNDIERVSLDIGTSGNAIADISNTGFRILTIVKRILM